MLELTQPEIKPFFNWIRNDYPNPNPKWKGPTQEPQWLSTSFLVGGLCKELPPPTHPQTGHPPKGKTLVSYLAPTENQYFLRSMQSSFDFSNMCELRICIQIWTSIIGALKNSIDKNKAGISLFINTWAHQLSQSIARHHRRYPFHSIHGFSFLFLLSCIAYGSCFGNHIILPTPVAHILW